MTESPEVVVSEWLQASASAATRGEHKQFMDLISSHVSLLGVPGFELIDYDDWSRQAKDEFVDGVVKRVDYKGSEIVAAGLTSIIFRAVETVELVDGPPEQNGIEGTLGKESDGKWRLTQERILSPEEAHRYNLPLEP